MFLIVLTALGGLIATLLWYTNWAERRILEPEPEVRTARTP